MNGKTQNTAQHKSELSADELTLAEFDADHRIYLCEYGIVHVLWGENNLPYCPGDFIGLPFVLYNLLAESEDQRTAHDADDTRESAPPVLFRFGGFHLPLQPGECRSLHDLVQAAVERLYALIRSGDIQRQGWRPA